MTALLFALLVLGAGLGSVLRAVVLDRVARSASHRTRTFGSAWVNVPAAALAAAAVVAQPELGLLPGPRSDAGTVAVVALLGLCGGLSTYSTLALEVATSVLGSRWDQVLLQLGGVVAGVLGGLFGAGLAALALLLA